MNSHAYTQIALKPACRQSPRTTPSQKSCNDLFLRCDLVAYGWQGAALGLHSCTVCACTDVAKPAVCKLQQGPRFCCLDLSTVLQISGLIFPTINDVLRGNAGIVQGPAGSGSHGAGDCAKRGHEFVPDRAERHGEQHRRALSRSRGSRGQPACRGTIGAHPRFPGPGSCGHEGAGAPTLQFIRGISG